MMNNKRMKIWTKFLERLPLEDIDTINFVSGALMQEYTRRPDRDYVPPEPQPVQKPTRG